MHQRGCKTSVKGESTEGGRKREELGGGAVERKKEKESSVASLGSSLVDASR